MDSNSFHTAQNPHQPNLRRQVPRRVYEASAGVLHRGEYRVERIFQISEGGCMIGSQRKIAVGDLVVITVRVPSSNLFVVRGVVRSALPPVNSSWNRYGVEFQTLEFSAKREIRNFVAQATRYDSPAY